MYSGWKWFKVSCKSWLDLRFCWPHLYSFPWTISLFMVAVFLFKESNMFLKTNRFLNEFPEYLNLRHQVHQNRNIIILCVYLKLRPKFSSLEPEHNAAAAKSLQSCLTVRPYRQLLCPWDSPGKNTGVGYHFLLHEHMS